MDSELDELFARARDRVLGRAANLPPTVEGIQKHSPPRSIKSPHKRPGRKRGRKF